jgi:protein-L-isoaspartate(D-aspartate) O-methyltransferase
MDEFFQQRMAMVSYQIERRGVRDECVLSAMRSVLRHEFVPPEMRVHAYEDCPLSIGLGQTISQPYIVALMTELLRLKGTENVLEIGTGSGYQAAVLSALANRVHTIERHAELAERAKKKLSDLGYLNVSVQCADGTQGYPKAAPYEGILVTAAAPEAPQPLLDQLAEGGRLVIPVGQWGTQMLQVWTKVEGKFESTNVIPVVFVPLRGEFGWKEGTE